MHAGLITSIFALAGSSLAFPLETRAGEFPPANYEWQVTGWSAGCARAGCYYDFNVTGQAATSDGNPSIPAFQAYCSGDESNDFKECKMLGGAPSESNAGNTVSATLFPQQNASWPDGIAKAAVKYHIEFPQDGPSGSAYTFTGYGNSTYNQFAAPLQSFKIKPTEATGIA